MDSDDSEAFEAPPITFDVKLPDDMNSGEVITLLEVLQSDVEGFDQMLIDCAQQNETGSPTVMETATEAASQSIPDVIRQNACTSTRFKSLNEEDLHQIEQNQYSEATKKNTKWGIRLFNGEQ